MRPSPRAAMSLRTASARCTVEAQLSSTMPSSASRSVSTNGPPWPTPALSAAAANGRPAPATAAASRSTSARLVRSTLTGATVAPIPRSSSTASSSSTSSAATIRSKPFSANCLASSRPMPLEAPVTRASGRATGGVTRASWRIGIDLSVPRPPPPHASGGDGDPHAAARLRAVALDLALQVQRRGHGRAPGDLRRDQVGRQQPGDLELDAVGVTGVQRLGGRVVGRADQCTRLQQRVADPGQLGQRVDLPREVVEPDRAAAGLRGARTGTDLEQAQVVVVRRTLGLQEDGGTGDLRPGTETEDVPVEGVAALDVTDVEDGVVEALDGHEGLLTAGRRMHPAATCLIVQVFLSGNRVTGRRGRGHRGRRPATAAVPAPGAGPSPREAAAALRP